MSEWKAYVAGFFDGEGSIVIARTRADGLSDYHCIKVSINQRSKYRTILDRIAAEYGGYVILRQQKTRVKKMWAETALWQLQHKANIQRFLQDIQPYCVVKAPQIAIALEFLRSFEPVVPARDNLGRIRGKTLRADEIERRERLRLKMREANELGPPKAKPSALPPLDVQERRRAEAEVIGDMATVPRGESHYRATVTDDLVRAIRAERAKGLLTLAALAARFGISQGALERIVYRKTWRHVDDLPPSSPSPAAQQPPLFDADA